MPVDPLSIDELYRKYMLGRITDDEEENATRNMYSKSLTDLQRNRKQAISQLSVNMADRGLTHSGPALQAGLDTNAEFDMGQSQLGTDMTSTLARIAKKRLMDDATYNMQRSMY
jgi:hypothetical protein